MAAEEEVEETSIELSTLHFKLLDSRVGVLVEEVEVQFLSGVDSLDSVQQDSEEQEQED